MTKHRARNVLSGKLTSTSDGAPPIGTLVAGWCSGAHQSRLSVSNSHILNIPAGMSPEYATVRLAAIATASCIVEQTARARSGDIFQTFVPNILRQVIRRICQHYGATVISNDSRPGVEVDFVVRLSEATDNSSMGRRSTLYVT